ncbi:MAG TPA: hypothetical protein PKZ44_08345 [Flavobacterium sp.]|jgi:hypothetical protein|nr:hypothetical protein [Flavobacterium sp.]
MKKTSSKPEMNNSLEDLQLDFKKETYFSSTEKNDNDDWLDDEQDNFFYNYDSEEIEDNYEGFEFDNFD